MTPAPPTGDDAVQGLAALAAARARVLAHHRVMAVFLPGMLAAWDTLHDAVAGGEALSAVERNFIWIAVVAAARVPTGGAHVADFVAAGGTTQQVEAALAMGAAALGAAVHREVEPGWRAAHAALEPGAAYRRSVEAIARDAPVGMPLAHMALAAAHAACGSWDTLRLHLRAACDAGVGEPAMAQALALLVMPVGMPAFLRACEVWLRMADEGALPASTALLAASRWPLARP
jgi:alkylhydroperoxidase/carboxymuconolactone decarboxylase family protein YurZ